MTDTVLVACITAGATIICQLIISARSSGVIAYRVELLERKVDKLSDSISDMKSKEKKIRSNHRSENIAPYLPHFSPYTFNGNVM